jgi:choline dehydrogenase-like flavoprotein
MIGGGVRSSSATAYLQPALKRKNLHVLIENQVTQLIHSGDENGKPAFKKVEFAANRTCEYQWCLLASPAEVVAM